MCCNPESPFWSAVFRPRISTCFRPAVEPLEGRISLDGAEPPADADGSWCEVAADPDPDADPAPDDNTEPDPEPDTPLEDDPGDYPGDYPPPPPPLDPVAPGPAGPA